MPNSRPVVSVCIPTYNYRQYLSDALDSALDQEFANIEVVVVDNCSDDGTPELVEAYSRRDGRIVFHRNPRNLGMTANFNRCMELAQGKYVKFLCADDILKKDCVGKMVDVLDARPDVTLVGCRRSVFDGDKHAIRTIGYANRPFFRSGKEVIRDCYFRGNLIGEPTAVLFRKADVDAKFDEHYYHVLDMEMWFRLLENGSFVFVPEVLCGIREHGSRGTVDNLRTGKDALDKIRLFEEYGHKPYLRGSLMEKLRWDSRMALSVARDVAKKSTPHGRAAAKAVYHPAVFKNLLLPIAKTFTAFRSGR
jgi:glycosyltransferase involved in cell wall biosynthesis